MFTIFEMVLALLNPEMLDVLIKVEKVFLVILRLLGIELPTA